MNEPAPVLLESVADQTLLRPSVRTDVARWRNP